MNVGGYLVNTKQTERTHTDDDIRDRTEVSDRKKTEMDKTIINGERECE